MKQIPIHCIVFDVEVGNIPEMGADSAQCNSWVPSMEGFDQINLYKLLRYLQESKFARKVEGYLIHAEQQAVEAASTKAKAGEAADPTAPALILLDCNGGQKYH